MPAATTPAATRAKTKNGSPRKKGLKKKPTAVSKYEEELAFERTISRILLRRFEYDVARLFSTHVHRVAESHLPRLIMSVLQIAPPGWVALNANTEDVKDCELLLLLFYAGVRARSHQSVIVFRGALALDMRQAGERVATKSVLWSYTAIRHFVRLLQSNLPPLKRSQPPSIPALLSRSFLPTGRLARRAYMRTPRPALAPPPPAPHAHARAPQDARILPGPTGIHQAPAPRRTHQGPQGSRAVLPLTRQERAYGYLPP